MTNMEFSELTAVYQKLEEISGRIEMTSIISDFLGSAPDDELPTLILFLQGRAFPPWSDKELGIGGKLMIKAISNISGFPDEKVVDKVREKGDTGLAAEELLVNKTQTTLFKEKLTLQKVSDNLNKLAGLTGKGAQDKKISYINELLSFASPVESRYLVKIILEELRLGVGRGVVRDAIAGAFEVDAALVDRAYSLTSDLGEVARTAKKEGNAGLEKAEMKTGVPVEVMLAQKVGSIEEALEKFSPASFEVKYDGARIQIHKEGDRITLFTRRLESVTKQFPEIVEEARENITAKSAIVEGELVAIQDGRHPRPFQDLSRRIKRKYNIDEISQKIPVEINLFDAIYVEGKSKIDAAFKDRREILEKIVSPTEKFRIADDLITEDVKEAGKFYQKALDLGHEGVMVKNLDAPYQPGSRVGHMYKVKPIMETLDLVLVGATWGEGRRANWLASYLLAVLDPDSGQLLTIGRMGTGFTDEEFKSMTELLNEQVLEEAGKEVKLRPSVVVEVAYEEIQKSPTYESGYALRFPRLVRIREDKGVDDADTLTRVEEILGSRKGQ
ncbi:MAG: ATP-dependent DNA ligase [Candidatus Altiarchaeales archaeon]|nr:ATP-dependent DNA ligase [Candidatus Altiarchaeales archaeon]